MKQSFKVAAYICDIYLKHAFKDMQNNTHTYTHMSLKICIYLSGVTDL